MKTELKITMAGGRNWSDSFMGNQGNYGFYWSSSPNGTNGYNMFFNSISINSSGNYGRADGLSVRCFKN
jgi:hypothetical protein